MKTADIVAELQRAIQMHVDEANRLHKLAMTIADPSPVVQVRAERSKWVLLKDAAGELGVHPETVWRRAAAKGANSRDGTRLVLRSALEAGELGVLVADRNR